MKTEQQNVHYYRIYDDLICRTTRTLKDPSLLEDMFNWFDRTCAPYPKKLKEKDVYPTAIIDLDKKDRKVITFVDLAEGDEFEIKDYKANKKEAA